MMRISCAHVTIGGAGRVTFEIFQASQYGFLPAGGPMISSSGPLAAGAYARPVPYRAITGLKATLVPPWREGAPLAGPGGSPAEDRWFPAGTSRKPPLAGCINFCPS